jgi:hypothetical protein
MIALRAVLIAMAVLALPPGLAAAQACQEAEAAGWMSGGLLAKRTFKDAAGRPETAFILEMPQPECLRGKAEEDNVGPTRRIQIYSSNAAMTKTIAGLVGKRVMVEGRAFGAITVHHHAPIVVDVSSIDRP